MNCLTKTFVRASFEANLEFEMGTYGIGSEPRDMKPRGSRPQITGFQRQTENIMTSERVENRDEKKREDFLWFLNGLTELLGYNFLNDKR